MHGAKNGRRGQKPLCQMPRAKPGRWQLHASRCGRLPPCRKLFARLGKGFYGSGLPQTHRFFTVGKRLTGSKINFIKAC
jgi:hypothetical protein